MGKSFVYGHLCVCEASVRLICGFFYYGVGTSFERRKNWTCEDGLNVGKMAKNGRWMFRWLFKLDVHFGGNWMFKTLAKAYCEGI